MNWVTEIVTDTSSLYMLQQNFNEKTFGHKAIPTIWNYKMIRVNLRLEVKVHFLDCWTLDFHFNLSGTNAALSCNKDGFIIHMDFWNSSRVQEYRIPTCRPQTESFLAWTSQTCQCCIRSTLLWRSPHSGNHPAASGTLFAPANKQNIRLCNIIHIQIYTSMEITRGLNHQRVLCSILKHGWKMKG